MWKPRIKHWLRFTPEYSVWCDMKNRCNNTKFSRYCDWGGRWIKVCDRWLDDVRLFVEDMGLRPWLEYSLDRIDNDKDYCKENCKWSSREEQQHNKRNNFLVEYEWSKKTIAEWASIFNINVHTLTFRIKQLKWDIDKAITKPIKHKLI